MMTLKRILVGALLSFVSFFCISFIYAMLSGIISPLESVANVASLCAVPLSIAVAVYIVKKRIPVTEEEIQKKATKSEIRNAKAAIRNPAEKPQAPLFLIDGRAKLRLVGGLGDLPQGTACEARYNTDQITLSASGQEFILDASKMIDVSVMTQKEIQTQYVSSIGGAVAGAVLLGPLGAIIGGAASKKKITNKKKYLVIAYISDGETKYLVFDVTKRPADGNNIKSAYRFLKKNEKVKVDL